MCWARRSVASPRTGQRCLSWPRHPPRLNPSPSFRRSTLGARQAYETIVRSYHAGDRAALKPLLSPTVLESFEAGITARETRGEREEVEFLQGPRADLEIASAEGDKAVAKVRFLAELRSKVFPADMEATSEPRVEERRTAEHWTFERSLGATDPNWVLARVEPASA